MSIHSRLAILAMIASALCSFFSEQAYACKTAVSNSQIHTYIINEDLDSLRCLVKQGIDYANNSVAKKGGPARFAAYLGKIEALKIVIGDAKAPKIDKSDVILTAFAGFGERFSDATSQAAKLDEIDAYQKILFTIVGKDNVVRREIEVSGRYDFYTAHILTICSSTKGINVGVESFFRALRSLIVIGANFDDAKKHVPSLKVMGMLDEACTDSAMSQP